VRVPQPPLRLEFLHRSPFSVCPPLSYAPISLPPRRLFPPSASLPAATERSPVAQGALARFASGPGAFHEICVLAKTLSSRAPQRVFCVPRRLRGDEGSAFVFTGAPSFAPQRELLWVFLRAPSGATEISPARKRWESVMR
jgi:hypothetical protein